MKIHIKNLGEFQLDPGKPLKLLLPEIKKINLEKELPIAFKLNGEIIDWHTPIFSDVEELILEPLYSDSKEALEVLRHTASHLLAQAVKELFPGAKLGIGPAIEEGFYYDIYYERSFSEEDLKLIEKKIKELIKKNLSLERRELSKEEAKKLFSELKEDFKLELIEEFPDSKVSIYTQGEFIDLCRGPHLLSTGQVKALKLLSVSGAYWREMKKILCFGEFMALPFLKKRILKII